MFPIQSLAVECEVCLSHAGGSKVTKRIFGNSAVESAILIQSLFRLSVFTSPCTSHPPTIELCYVLAHLTLKYSEIIIIKKS